MRALRIELRRSVAAGAVLLLILVGIAEFLYGTPGGWTSMTTMQREGMLLSWPLAVGVGAWQARRERMAGIGELFVTSPRSPAQRLAPVALALALAAVSAYLLVLLLGTVLVGRSPADLYFTVAGGAEAAVGAISLVTAAWLGLWLGRLVPSAFTAPLATVLAVALVSVLQELETFSTTGPAFSLLLPALQTPYQQDHVQLPLELSVRQGVWLAALAVGAFAITTASTWLRRVLALLPAVAAALVLIPALPLASASEAFVVNQDALTPVCTQDRPKVCVIKAHSGLLDEVTGPTRAALKVLSALPDPPTSASEIPEPATPLFRPGTPEPPVAETPRDPHVLALQYQRDSRGHVEERGDLTASLLANAWSRPGCPPRDWTDQQRERFWAAQDVVGAWLGRQAGVTPAGSSFEELAGPGRQALAALPASTQRERIIAYRDAALACRDVDVYAQLTKAAR